MTTAAGRDADVASDLGGGGLDPILAGAMLRSAGLMAGTVAQVARAVAQSPGAAARHAARGLQRQLQVAAGAGEELPELDRRFADPAWRDNPFLRRLAQSYLVWSDALRDGVAQTPLDNRARYRPALENRAHLELARLLADPVLRGRGIPGGDGPIRVGARLCRHMPDGFL
jgi:polyhydroxyalkanoate synthase subunit PhaC